MDGWSTRHLLGSSFRPSNSTEVPLPPVTLHPLNTTGHSVTHRTCEVFVYGGRRIGRRAPSGVDRDRGFLEVSDEWVGDGTPRFYTFRRSTLPLQSVGARTTPTPLNSTLLPHTPFLYTPVTVVSDLTSFHHLTRSPTLYVTLTPTPTVPTHRGRTLGGQRSRVTEPRPLNRSRIDLLV